MNFSLEDRIVPPSVSILILNYNGQKFVERCLTSVLNTSYSNIEVIFVDNASTDGSLQLVRDKFSGDARLKIVVNDKNYGPAQGYNIGAKYAKSEYIVFLNNDTEVDSNWLSGLIEIMNHDLTVGATACKQLLMNDRKRIDCLGGFIDVYGFVHLPRRLEIDAGQYNKMEEVFVTGLTALVVRKDVFDSVGGFDPQYFMYYEDNDLTWRIWLSGHRILSVRSSVVYHASGGTTKRVSSYIVIFHNEKNKITTFIKNLSLHSLIRILPIIIVFEVAGIIFFAVKRRPYHSVAVIRAMLWVIANLKYVWFQHLRVNRFVRKVSDKEILKLMRKVDLETLWQKVSDIKGRH